MSLKLTLSHITKHYDGKTVLSDCSYSFDRSGVYAFMGPNGSGKSTLLRVCALLEQPDAGEVSYVSGGDVLQNDMSLKRRITLVLPKVGVFNTTVFKNASYGLKMRDVESKEVQRRVDRVLDVVGLVHKKQQNALTLSSGETQRLGIARALAIGPEVLFLDEPTASIDEENAEIVEGIILNMRREAGTTIIITTHDKDQAARLADRVVMMHDGGIVQQQ